MSADPLAVLARLLNEKAARGETFTEAEAEIDLTLRDESERDRAARWGWTRHRARRLITTGTAPEVSAGRRTDLEEPGSEEVPQPSPTRGQPEVNQKTAIPAPQGGEVNQGQPEVNHPQPDSSPSIGFPPLPLKGEPPPAPSGKIEKRSDRPSLADVVAYAEAHASPRYRRPELAEPFFDHFEKHDWCTGRKKVDPVKDWHAAFRQWCRRQEDFDAERAEGVELVDPLEAMTRTQAKALAATHGLTAQDFYQAAPSASGVPLWRCRVERLLAVGAVSEAEVLAKQTRPS